MRPYKITLRPFENRFKEATDPLGVLAMLHETPLSYTLSKDPTHISAARDLEVLLPYYPYDKVLSRNYPYYTTDVKSI